MYIQQKTKQAMYIFYAGLALHMISAILTTLAIFLDNIYLSSILGGSATFTAIASLRLSAVSDKILLKNKLN